MRASLRTFAATSRPTKLSITMNLQHEQVDWYIIPCHVPKEICSMRGREHSPLLPEIFNLDSREAFQGRMAATQVPEEPGADLRMQAVI